jgi:hypothetical protein
MFSYSQAYDNRNYDPAMPVAEISLISTVSGEPAITLVALIDSGADATMLPIEALKTADAYLYQTRTMRGVTGQAVPVDTYYTVIQLGSYTIYGIKAVAVPANSEPILGRDVLNQLELTLNGPAQELWLA